MNSRRATCLKRWRPLALPLLFKPDKNSLEYKALEAACTELHTTPQRLMLETGGIASPLALHQSKFLFEHFPKGTGFAPVELPAAPDTLPVANVQAFSIDDITTTEIDDAMSVTTLADGKIKVGIHIAAPGLGIRPDDLLDTIARHRLSTVYMPGDKITMLPDELVERYTLGAGQVRPALSLYATLDPADWSLLATETKVEAVPVANNLRHNDLDSLVTPENLASDAGDYPHKAEIALLWQWAQALEQARMAKREGFGLRPEQTNRIDFNFYVDNGVVTIERRQRGAPLDKIVAELMIFANSNWGKLMHEHGVPGIYRSQGRTGWGGKMQVRMVTHAAPHQGLGVDQYAWSTSPAAALYRPCQPVANHRLRRKGRSRAAGCTVPTQGCEPVCDRLRLRCRVCCVCRVPDADGTLLVPALAGAARRETG